MPGGLTRAATGADARVISMQRGGSSKDTWVLSTGPVSTFSLLQARDRAAGPGAHRPQPVQPRGGEPVLVRPLRRALRRHRAPAARGAAARDRGSARRERARAWPGIVGLLRHTGILAEGERERRRRRAGGARCAPRSSTTRSPASPSGLQRAAARRLAAARAPVAGQLAHAQPHDAAPAAQPRPPDRAVGGARRARPRHRRASSRSPASRSTA